MTKNIDIEHPVIFFDGDCNLCSASVQFTIKRDIRKVFRFASLQSEIGGQVLASLNLPKTTYKTFVLYENGKFYFKSTAALRVARRLNNLWPLLYGFVIIPAFIRNGIYDVIARNRYQWFGRNNTCWLPSPEYMRLFIR